MKGLTAEKVLYFRAFRAFRHHRWRDDEPATVEAMHRFMEEQGYMLYITDKRMHNEIYLSDVRKVAPEKLKTVIRHPIRER